MVGAVLRAEWAQYCYLEMVGPKFKLEDLKQRLQKLSGAGPNREILDGDSGKLLIKDTGDSFFKETLVVTDAKSLFDALQKEEAKGKEPR
eukprot:8745894-Alexandrium_andersonii.AAC.1